MLPYFIAGGAWTALIGSIVLAGIALTTTGVVVSALSGISLKRKVLELVGAGFAAAAIAYLFGWSLRALTGVSL